VIHTYEKSICVSTSTAERREGHIIYLFHSRRFYMAYKLHRCQLAMFTYLTYLCVWLTYALELELELEHIRP